MNTNDKLRHIADITEECPDCGGRGDLGETLSYSGFGDTPQRKTATCEKCGGTEDHLGTGTVPLIDGLWEPDPDCFGHGQITLRYKEAVEHDDCSSCNGTGRVLVSLDRAGWVIQLFLLRKCPERVRWWSETTREGDPTANAELLMLDTPEAVIDAAHDILCTHHGGTE